MNNQLNFKNEERDGGTPVHVKECAPLKSLSLFLSLLISAKDLRQGTRVKVCRTREGLAKPRRPKLFWAMRTLNLWILTV